ncbi:MAG: pyruvate dehydrogenase E2 component (dihydrolipoamide acetyltransferase) [Loktanella salsilacus]|jgi:pyruvate dehydrogenase E2 component (dihydrolipoamide acetyltransferase)|uniref:Acetyltransferase component of pyruvate dehydrogenase complex n=1 Tax=Loktanella salsilacus TaxID=195913 RepID=A0A1I4EC09_9RHOB|nr:pyruvate dehydrogenase complex dihydrolipoamide acetyltransferase [Loktanella salsilacus]MBU1835216.1 pyruvate dehydrogenase complex dihydrolipoamide acetyltransferase [Alphaproteobacteria bacterium]UTH46880.1 pyruvate dehydrogenase complex dihydrolipoamide acetyltransferase [Loktanella salsilacus]SFL02803.1 pyruvate dehydrogenase E2 component (dihydrolipoamide acetyltransferase) [Loktanella salsilacus]|tara:strand:- start:52 stop:1389 length:1338 start_codon:yes stop_codon:yes gene_type:complete
MPTEILMPALSPTMEEGTLAKWLVKEGDTVSSGDLLAEIETDKATMEFEAVDEGVIGKIMVAEGTEGVKVNAVIAVLLMDGESADDIGAASAPKAAASSNAAPADAPKAEEPAKGYGRDGDAAQGDKAPVKDGNRVFASPLARRIAADKGLDLSGIQGSGPKGRIVKADVENATAQPKAAASAAPAAKADAPAAAKGAAMASGPSTEQVIKMYDGRPFEEVKLDGMRKTIAARLTEAKQSVPHFYLRRDIVLDDLMKFRAQLNKQLEGRGVKLSVNDFIIKACALALQQVPEANAVWAGDRTLKFTKSDVAVAVAIEGGLFTPVLKDAEMKSLSALSSEMKDLATRARDRKLAPHEYQGGSFAISNLGMFGIDNFDAIINPPHSAILAVGAGAKKPIVGKDGELAVGTVMSVTLSVDHRVIDGALGANLLNAIKDNLENPMTMLA